jgi:phosphoenolpyruvate carboxykinase (ATP)
MDNNTLFTQSISLKDLGIESTKIHTSYLQKNYTTLPYKLIKGELTGALAVNTGEYTVALLKIVLS